MYHDRVHFGQAARYAVILGGLCVLCLAVSACTPPSAVERAMSFSRQNKNAEAIATLRQDLAAHPDHIDSRRLLIRVLAVTGDLGAAEAEVKVLEQTEPEGDPTPLIELGHAFELAHKFDEALAAYDEAAKRAPASPLGPREGGMRAARWGESEIAIPRLEEALRRGANDTEILHILGLAKLHAGDADGAMKAYADCAARETKDVRCVLGEATVALKKNDYAAALASYDAVIARAPSHAAAYLGRAYCLAMLERKDEALHAIDRAEELGAPKENVTKLRELAKK